MVASEEVRGAGVVRDAGDRGVSGYRSSGAAGVRSCARPGCPAGAEATLRFAYREREAVIEPLGDERRPQTYDLCGPHAARTHPPHGWTLRDLVPGATRPEDLPTTSASHPRGRDAGALFAAALTAAADGGARATSTSTGR